MSAAGSRRRVILVGAGGLGGPLALALAADATTELVLIDPDVVELSNLQRQIQFRTEDVGASKVACLEAALVRRGIDRERLASLAEALTPANADRLLAGATLVVEGTDDPATKFLVNDWCQQHVVPYVIAAVGRYSGNVFAGLRGHGGCYRCLFETPPDADQAPSCADQGVLGAAVGFIAGIAAGAAHRLLVAPAEVAATLAIYDDLRQSAAARSLTLSRRTDCVGCVPPAARGSHA